jgi:multiple sugar transport system permease protein
LTEFIRRIMRKKHLRPPAEAEASISFARDLKMNWELYLFLVPFFLVFSLMTVIPVLASIVLSFTYFNLFNFPQFIGLTNYVNLFLNDEIFGIAVKNTLFFAVITGPLGYILCFFMAWFINEMPHKIRVLLTFIFYAPSLSGSVYFIWQLLFSGDSYGIINGLLLQNHIIQEPIQWLSNPQYSMGILIIVQLWLSMGTGFLAFIAGLQGIDVTLYEAGDIDGIRNRYQEMIYITLPSMKPQLLFGAILQISASLSVSNISSALCGYPSTNYSAHTILLHMNDYGTMRYEMGYACAIAVVLFVMMLVIKKVVNVLMRYIGNE